jgi:hypothetical protein
MRVLSGLIVAAAVISELFLGSAPCAAEKWPGVDEAVVKRIAREQGREERASFFPVAEGDLQLFMFLMAGTVGGFAAGYYWRVLLDGRKKPGQGN